MLHFIWTVDLHAQQCIFLWLLAIVLEQTSHLCFSWGTIRSGKLWVSLNFGWQLRHTWGRSSLMILLYVFTSVLLHLMWYWLSQNLHWIFLWFFAIAFLQPPQCLILFLIGQIVEVFSSIKFKSVRLWKGKLSGLQSISKE